MNRYDMALPRTGPVGHLLRLAVVLVLILASLVGIRSGPDPADAATAHRELVSPVGTWDVTVTINTDPVQYQPLLCDMFVDQRVVCTNKPGDAELVGQGIWKTKGSHTFSFWITHHAETNEDGEVIASINANHLGRLSQHTFKTQGTTFIVPDDGSPWFGPIQVSSTGKKLDSHPGSES